MSGKNHRQKIGIFELCYIGIQEDFTEQSGHIFVKIFIIRKYRHIVMRWLIGITLQKVKLLLW